MHASAVRLHLMHTSTTRVHASALKELKLACICQIIEYGHAKTVIADETCYVRAF